MKTIKSYIVIICFLWGGLTNESYSKTKKVGGKEIELQADDLLMDERLGRKEALRLGIPIIGILGILLIAQQRNLIPQVQPVMDALINQAGFRVSPQLYQRVLTLSQNIETNH